MRKKKGVCVPIIASFSFGSLIISSQVLVWAKLTFTSLVFCLQVT
jgi:hypothetical protein